MSQQVYCNVATRNVTISSIVAKEIDQKTKELRRDLGFYIQTGRSEKKLSQDGLAKLVGMERNQIYRIENGLTGTTVETITKIAKVLELDADNLLLLSAGLEPKRDEVKHSSIMRALDAVPPEEKERVDALVKAVITPFLGKDFNFDEE